MKSPPVQVTITTNELNSRTREEMWQLYRAYYHYSKDYFMARIQRNNYFSFYTCQGRIVGFTGLRINRTEVRDRQYLLVYFGQTIIDTRFRGQSLIPRTATKLMLKYWKDLALGRIYVWADALTYKAYLVFAKNLEEYYPTFRKAMPRHVKDLVDYVGDEYYGGDYCKATGCVKKEMNLVNDPAAAIHTGSETDPDALFFAKTNQGYQKGNGLITMAPMHGLNYLAMVMKCLKKWVRTTWKGKHARPRGLELTVNKQA